MGVYENVASMVQHTQGRNDRNESKAMIAVQMRYKPMVHTIGFYVVFAKLKLGSVCTVY
jgi:hypothetical protein